MEETIKDIRSKNETSEHLEQNADSQKGIQQIDMDRLKSAKQAALNTNKHEANLTNYLLGEGTLFRSPPSPIATDASKLQD